MINHVNGKKHKQVRQARDRVLRYAREQGSITNKEAKKIGKWNQAWWHLNALVEAKMLRYEDYNCWVPVKRKKRGPPPLDAY